MPDFSKRSQEIEIMDDLSASGGIIDVTLKELETINLLLGGNYVTLNGISKLLNGRSLSEKIVLADLGCGSGDILKLMRKLLRKKGVEADLIGVDANPNIVAYAHAHTRPDENIRYEALNIFSDEFKRRKFDIVTGTLFFHHFTDEQLIDFYRQLKEQVRIGIVINDIHRHWFAYHSIKWLTQLFSKSTMVKNDAPVSVMRAFKKNELEHIVRQAGYSEFSIKWMWAFRWQVVIDNRK
jgi:2-polyprenyl-3-methyl-5-hydroxy-6-metoxy-1,4-benzoquinol methylase